MVLFVKCSFILNFFLISCICKKKYCYNFVCFVDVVFVVAIFTSIYQLTVIIVAFSSSEIGWLFWNYLHYILLKHSTWRHWVLYCNWTNTCICMYVYPEIEYMGRRCKGTESLLFRFSSNFNPFYILHVKLRTVYVTKYTLMRR